MTVLIDKNTFDSVLLDTTNVAYIAENFTYLITKLIDFVGGDVGKPPKDNKNWPASVNAGQKRIVRAMRGPQLGYQYTEAAAKLVTKSGQSKVVHAFGENVLVDIWTVSHPNIKDPDLGETYPTHNPSTGDLRGPYTCLITARISLEKRTPTRCYVQCNCKDFQTSFYEQLHEKGYTNIQGLPKSKGKKLLTPAICKHLYAVYKQNYSDLVKEIEGFDVDESPVLFGGKDTGHDEEIEDHSQENLEASKADEETLDIDSMEDAGTSEDQKATTAKTKSEAIDLVKTSLKEAHLSLQYDPEAYLDSRVGGKYHKYMFFVIRINQNIRAIAYRNKNKAGYSTKAPFAVLQVPDNPKIWALFARPKGSNPKHRHPDFELLWGMIRELGEMPDSVLEPLEAKGRLVIFEDVDSSLDQATDLTYLVESKSSIILSSISELS